MYGLCIFLGITFATLIGERLCKKSGLDVQVYWQAVFYGILFGLFGARIYHVVHRADYFVQNPLEIVAIWQGGLGIWGGIFGGLLGIFLSIKKTGKLFCYIDVFAVVAPLAQAVGRWGNYFNKELFGYPTNLPWGIYIPQELRPQAFKYFDFFHPLFLYESILNFVLFVFLYTIYGRQKIAGIKLSAGFATMMYLAGYSVIRFFLECMRIDPWRFFGIPVAGLLSAFVFVSSVVSIYVVQRNFDS
jgi:phosphatidylglycerol---prolipoprotein diacylglyceryl transferase